MRRSNLVAILTDVHLWVPVVVLILGTTLLMTLR
ncbi:MAG: translocated intimin receptor Tir [Terracidiphilus sp.]